MYVPAQFKEQEPEVLQQLIEDYPLGILITQGDGMLDAIHIPFEINRESGTLRAHVARANPVWQNITEGTEVLVVFRGGDAYISPNWYPSKALTHKQVPTWNYRAVHVRGQVAFRHDETFLRELLTNLTRKNESSQPAPWSMDDAPAEYISAMLKAIVGVEINISDMTGVLKLSQNKSSADLQGAGENVVKTGNEIIGQAMLAHLKAP